MDLSKEKIFDFRITFTGDIMLEKEQIAAVGTVPYSATISPVASAFRNSDYIIGSLETPVAGGILPVSEHKWSFNAPPAFLEMLVTHNINYVLTANNHCLDRGVIGLKQTIDALEKANLNHIGTYSNHESNKIFLFTKGEKKVAILTATYGTNALFNNQYLADEEQWMVSMISPQEKLKSNRENLKALPKRIIRKLSRDILGIHIAPELSTIHEEKIKMDIEEARKYGANFIIYCPHMGEQYESVPSLYSQRVAKIMTQNGVDLIVANHNHSILPIQWINNRVFIAHCLGNFTSSPDSEAGKGIENYSEELHTISILLHLDFYKNQNYPQIIFQTTKTIYHDDGIAYTHLLVDLIKNESNILKRQKYIEEHKNTVGKILGISPSDIEIKKEYNVDHEFYKSNRCRYK